MPPQETRTVLGGGCSEMLMAAAVDELAKVTAGKEALAVEAFSRALRGVYCVKSVGVLVFLTFIKVYCQLIVR